MKKLLSIVFSLFLGATLYGQSLERQVIGSSGSFLSNVNSSLSFTVGEVVIQYASMGNISLSQGFQQAEMEETISVVEVNPLIATATIFPNPATETLKIKSDLSAKGIHQLNYNIMDMQGKVMSSGDILSDGGDISILGLANSTYILELISLDGTFSQHIRFTKL